MADLLPVEYLKSGGTYAGLLEEHGVNAKPHNGKVSLVYHQWMAREDDPLACQCRGLILREGTWDVLAHPFNRFFNHDQPVAAPIDWSTARFEEKLDGTLGIIHWDDHAKRWFFGTRSMCEGQGDINGVGTFAQLADKWARERLAPSFSEWMDARGADQRVTYMCELTGPYNTIVCRYSELNLTILGARSIDTGAELDPSGGVNDDTSFAQARTWNFNDISHLLEVVKDWDPREYEGVIVKDAEFNRVKVKSPKYLAVAHAGESIGASWRSACAAVASGACDGVSDLLPPLAAERMSAVKLALKSLTETTDRDLAELADVTDMKSFAFQAVTRSWPAALFALKRNKVGSLDEFIRGATPDHLLEVLKKHGLDTSVDSIGEAA